MRETGIYIWELLKLINLFTTISQFSQNYCKSINLVLTDTISLYIVVPNNCVKSFELSHLFNIEYAMINMFPCLCVSYF